jgi:hypothetical protein
MKPMMTHCRLSIRGDLKTTADKAYDDRKHADGAEANEDFIVIKANMEVDMCCFRFLYLLE